MFATRKVKASHNSEQDQHLYESYFLLLKNLASSEKKDLNIRTNASPK